VSNFATETFMLRTTPSSQLSSSISSLDFMEIAQE